MNRYESDEPLVRREHARAGGGLVARQQPGSPRQRVRAGGGDQALRHPVVDVAEAVEAPSIEDDAVVQGAPVELHVSEVLEQDVDRLDVGTLELLASQRGPMHSREVVDLLAHDDAEVLEAHPVDALVNGRDELDERDRSPIEDIERLGEHDQGNRTPVPDVLSVRHRMALEKRPLLDVQVPIGDADGEVAERVRGDVDAAGNKTVALHGGEGSIVPDDLGDRIRRRHVASSSAIVRTAETRSRTSTQVVRSRARDALEEAFDLGYPSG